MRIKVTLPVDLPTLMADVRSKHVEVALNWADGNIRKAAQLLGMSPRTLANWVSLQRGPQRVHRTPDLRQLPLPLEAP